MKNFPINTTSGFTLMEMLVAMALGAFVLIMLMMIMIPSFKNIRDIRATQKLHADSVQIIDTLSYYAEKATLFTVPNSSTLVISLPDGSFATTTLNGTAITEHDLLMIDSDTEVTSLQFKNLARSFRMSFTLKNPETGKTFSATTTITRRNGS